MIGSMSKIFYIEKICKTLAQARRELDALGSRKKKKTVSLPWPLGKVSLNSVFLLSFFFFFLNSTKGLTMLLVLLFPFFHFL